VTLLLVGGARRSLMGGVHKTEYLPRFTLCRLSPLSGVDSFVRGVDAEAWYGVIFLYFPYVVTMWL